MTKEIGARANDGGHPEKLHIYLGGFVMNCGVLHMKRSQSLKLGRGYAPKVVVGLLHVKFRY